MAQTASWQDQMNALRTTGTNPYPAAAAAAARAAPQSQPALPSVTDGVVGASPRTPDSVVAAQVPVRPVVTPQPQISAPSGVVGESPHTPDDVQEAYARTLQGKPAASNTPVVPATALSVPSVVAPTARAIADPLGGFRSAVNSDVQAEAARGAQTSTADAAGLAARELVVSPVSRGMEAAANATRPLRDAASTAIGDQIDDERATIQRNADAAKSVWKGVRAFITGNPGAPAAAPAAVAPAVAAAAPTAATAAPPSVVASAQPVAAPATTPTATPTRTPATIDGRTGQVITTSAGAPITLPAPAPGQWEPSIAAMSAAGQNGEVERGGYTGMGAGGDPAIAAAAASLQGAPAAAPGAVPATPQIPSVSLIPPKFAQGEYAPGYTPEFHSALGNLMAAGVAMHDAARQNAQAQTTFGNQLKVGKYGQDNAKLEGELQKGTSEIGLNNARVGLVNAETGKTTAETGEATAKTAQTQAQTRNAVQLEALKGRLAKSSDPDEQRELIRKINALQGKAQPKYQVVEKQDVDPATGIVIKTPVIIDENGTARAVQVQGNGGGAGSGAPAGMTYVGKSPEGKRVFKDAQGKQHIEA